MASARDESRRPPLFSVVLRPILAFLELEAASGILLLASAVAALSWVNLGGAASYHAFLSAPLTVGVGGASLHFDLHELVNDGLMTVFFLVVGMEIKRELVMGELASPARALLPGVAALGGMLVPGLIYFALNRGGAGQPGWGIPMATDIAFCIAILTMLKSRVPHGLTVFVTALAIFDDILVIVVIAVFYGHGLDLGWLSAATALTAMAAWMGRAHVRRGVLWSGVGVLLWLILQRGGVHGTIAGVVVGLCVPARPRTSPRLTLLALSRHLGKLTGQPEDESIDGAALGTLERDLEAVEAPLDRFLRILHPWTAFLIMPLFALANSGVDLSRMDGSRITSAITLGTALGLAAGKVIGICSFTVIGVKLGRAPMPGGASLAKLIGAATVAGVGFTVALFIAGLAFPGQPDLLDEAKAGILAGSSVAGLAGAAFLMLTARLDRAPVATPGTPPTG